MYDYVFRYVSQCVCVRERECVSVYTVCLSVS